MADDLSSALRELADSAGRPAPTTGAEVRRRAASRRRRRHTAVAGGTAVVAAALVFGLTMALGGPESHRRPAPPVASPTVPSPTAPSPTAPSPTAPTAVVACAEGDLAFSATNEDEEGKSVRHLLLTVTNTGNKRCNVYHYPYLKFAYAREAFAVIKDSEDAPATLAPGEKAYAALLANGGGMDTYDTNTIPLSLQGPDLGSKVSEPNNLDLPGRVAFDDGARVTYWTTAPGLALRFIMSS
ncbi:DUF4232 domain-containing protein [Streptomyces sp. NBC_00162]|uniref:DUF4232 domain-containing protein n=1 Tax=Streptomyces sp. NBC_00162 TaxID=2903629 RepID=UPI00214C98CB|nr:DUF4232 domain-containing protein [Streptomyces sp. NBC_00162]UUU37977.1 DUF4232 domain-containing protein [Streptomyces sp. NBC_00162]